MYEEIDEVISGLLTRYILCVKIWLMTDRSRFMDAKHLPAIKSNAYFFIEGWCAAKRIKRDDMEVIKKEVNQIIFDIIAKK